MMGGHIDAYLDICKSFLNPKPFLNYGIFLLSSQLVCFLFQSNLLIDSIASFYSYLALTYLLKNRSLLSTYDVTVE